ncbi:MAG TPA: hypothetical protein GXX64_13135 [Bacteroidales bacterium]|nr:hypothetical protein [Bacteroidales bacterium]
MIDRKSIKCFTKQVRESWGKSTPDEGGYFEDPSISIEGHDVTELLLPEVMNEILEKAEEAMRE